VSTAAEAAARPAGPPRARGRPLGGMAIARLAFDLGGIALSAAIGIAGARLLGPAGKGDLAVLAVLATIGIHLSATGIGEAAIVGVARRRAAEGPAFATAVAWSLAVGCLCAAMLGILAATALSIPVSPTVLLIATAPLGALVVNANQFLLLRGRIATIGAISVASLGVTLAGYLLVALSGVPRLAGAAAAGLAGAALAVAATGCVTLRQGLRPSRRLDRVFLRWAIGYGAVAELAYLIGTVSARGDTVLVYSLAGQREAGLYSVALTYGVTVAAAPWALSYVSFPRLAHVPAGEAAGAIAEVCRVGIVASIAVSAPAAIAAPFLIPLAFGSSFAGAGAAAVILTLGTTAVAAQVLLCRGVAARGHPRAMLASYLSNVATMVGLDLVLIPWIGLSGAALGSVCSALVGFVAIRIGARRWARREGIDPALLHLVPGRADVHHLRAAVSSLLARAAATGRRA
jgi:O-antigen/teichoic acid export membrane protein